MSAPLMESKVEQLRVRLYENRRLMGEEAARLAAARIRSMQAEKGALNIIFAAAPSQNEFLAALLKEEGIAWEKIRAFHMDEYLGLAPEAPQAFGKFLRDRILGLLPFSEVHYIKGDTADAEAECRRYAALLERYPPDLVFLGIGENNHIAFNDPPVADFRDAHLVKVVDLDQACRQQQVNDGCFATINDVPSQAITLTIPALMQAKALFCMVPGPTKANAVFHTLQSPLSETYPSTILRTHPDAQLFIDRDSASMLPVIS